MSIEIIAEAGCNHAGDISAALEMVKTAAQCGADTVKFQCYKTDSLVNPREIESFCRKSELDEDALSLLIQECEKYDIAFLASAFDSDSLITLASLDCKSVKIPSGQTTNSEMLSMLNGLCFEKVYLSTGMCTLGEVTRSMNILEHNNMRRDQIVLMHCTTAYPCPAEDANLNVLKTYRIRFGNLLGYSDHTRTHAVACAAVALGATVIEKHFMLDESPNNGIPMPDEPVSFKPNELAEFIHNIRETEKAMGSYNKLILKKEFEMLHRKGKV